MSFSVGDKVICLTTIYEPCVKYKSHYTVIMDSKFGVFLDGYTKDLYFYPNMFILVSDYRKQIIQDICK